MTRMDEKRIHVTFYETLIIAIPLFVLTVGNYLIWKYSFTDINISYFIDPNDLATTYRDVSGRYKYLGTSFLVFFIQIITIVVFCYYSIKLLSARSILKIVFGLATWGFVIFFFTELAEFPFGWDRKYVGLKFTNEVLKNGIPISGCPETECGEGYFETLFDVYHVLFALSVGAILMGTISCLGRYRPGKETYTVDKVLVSEQIKRLQLYLYLGSAGLAVGLINVYLGFKWLAFPIDEPIFSQLHNDLLNSLALYWGINYSVALASLYIPVVYILKERSKDVSYNAPGEITLEFADSIKPILAMLGPLLVGAAGSVGEIFGSL